MKASDREVIKQVLTLFDPMGPIHLSGVKCEEDDCSGDVFKMGTRRVSTISTVMLCARRQYFEK